MNRISSLVGGEVSAINRNGGKSLAAWKEWMEAWPKAWANEREYAEVKKEVAEAWERGEMRITFGRQK